MVKLLLKIGAILSTENHEWFHQQPPEIQKALNEMFQEYKRQVDYDRFIGMAKSRQERKRDTWER